MPNQKDIDRFWARVTVKTIDECWPFDRGYGQSGYGKITLSDGSYWTHRLAFTLTNGQPKANVCHSCDNPICCNPKHLFDGTQKENIEDCIKKNRQAKPEQKARKGTKNGRAKINWLYVWVIRDLWSTGEYSRTTLCEIFDIPRYTLNQVIRHETWKEDTSIENI